jgi:IS1 family transposase/transposase-like protein
MTFISVRCPHGHSEPIVTRGKTHRGTPRTLGQNTACTKGSVLLDYRNRGCVPEVKHPIIDMSLNASGVRDTARVRHMSTETVLHDLRQQEAALESLHTAVRRTRTPEDSVVDVARAGEAAMDARWSFVGKTHEPRWWWHALDHGTGAVWADVFGRRKDEVCLQLKALLEPCGLPRYYTAHGGAYTRHLEPDVQSPGQRHMQHIERTHLT